MALVFGCYVRKAEYAISPGTLVGKPLLAATDTLLIPVFGTVIGEMTHINRLSLIHDDST